MKIFLSYRFQDPDQKFAELVHYFLAQQGLELFYWRVDGRAGAWSQQLADRIDECESMVAFLDEELGEVQEMEIAHFRKSRGTDNLIPVLLTNKFPEMTRTDEDCRVNFTKLTCIHASALDRGYALAQKKAEEIVRRLGVEWVNDDGLPNRYVIDCEKSFLEKFSKRDAGLFSTLRRECGWKEEQGKIVWPSVLRDELHPDLKLEEQENPIQDGSIGKISDDMSDSERVLLDARRNLLPRSDTELTLPEARPRKYLRFPLVKRGVFRVGILVSGGIAPGINAVIDGIVSRHSLYSESQKRYSESKKHPRPHFLEILGYRDGFRALFREGEHPQRLDQVIDKIRNVVEKGGSYLGTSRFEGFLKGSARERFEMLDQAVNRLRIDGINILYVIGGEGSMRCAHALWHHARRMQPRYDLSVVGIPKAMDNDILWVWQSFGFLSAVEEARQAILHMHTEVSSNPRVGIIQLFGSDSGFVASHAGYSTACDLVLIPEAPMTMEEIFQHVKGKLMERYSNRANNESPYAIVVMAETALPSDAGSFYKDSIVGLSDDEKKEVENFLQQGRQVRGQTPDELRTAGLKIVSKLLQTKIQNEIDPDWYWEDFRVITNEPRHLIRSIPPSVNDVIFGERLGTLAVDNAMAGYTDFMVSQWLTEFVLVPLQLVVLGRKKVSKDGIFWKSVVSKTGQPS
jgi:6-phosphofructokinase 1